VSGRAELLQIGVKRPIKISHAAIIFAMFDQLPSELFCEIALYLPLTKDVLAFTLTNSRIRRALSTPVLFKARLVLRGWDISAWTDEDDAAQSSGDLKRWMCIDHTYCRTIQLFDEAAVGGYFLITADSPIDEAVLWTSARPTSDPAQDNPGSLSHQVLDGDRTASWLEKLSKVLPLFVTHHSTYISPLLLCPCYN
jgi:hypothetical protein